jgi:hypothetical protein
VSGVEVYSEPVWMTIGTDSGHAGYAAQRTVQAPSYGWCCFTCGAERRGYRCLTGADSAADRHVCGCPTGNGEA